MTEDLTSPGSISELEEDKHVTIPIIVYSISSTLEVTYVAFKYMSSNDMAISNFQPESS